MHHIPRSHTQTLAEITISQTHAGGDLQLHAHALGDNQTLSLPPRAVGAPAPGTIYRILFSKVGGSRVRVIGFLIDLCGSV